MDFADGRLLKSLKRRGAKKTRKKTSCVYVGVFTFKMSKTTGLSMIEVALFVLALIGGSTAVDGDGLLSDRRRPRTLSAAKTLTGGADRWKDFDTVEWRADEEFVAAPRTADDDRLLLQRIVRQRRDAPNQPHIEKYMVSLNASHPLMHINWAGAGSQVIVALARDFNPTSSSTSRLFISSDYGKSFTEKFLYHSTSTPAVLHYFRHSYVVYSHYVFVDIIHKAIWTSTDYGTTTQRHYLQFIPLLIGLHPTNYNYMFGYDSNDSTGRLWISSNFGSSWRVLHAGVESFSWGIPPYDSETTAYINTSPGSPLLPLTAMVLRYRNITSTSQSPEELFTDSQNLLVVGKFIFATKRGDSNGNDSLELYVSYNRGPFRKAIFPSRHSFKEFYVADADEDQVFICACINSTSTNLYISDSRGERYSLSLENIMFYSPTNSFHWMTSAETQSFADLRRVKGLDGIYIATKVINATRYSFTVNQVTVMSFNKGGDWHRIPSPEKNSTGSYTCGRTSFRSVPQPNCHLQLVETFRALTSYSRYASVFTSSSAIGLVIANGNIGSQVSSTGFNVYLSNDGGLRFNEVLSGTHYYTMGDHGGLIVAIRMYQITGDLLYSFDEGESWNEYMFLPNNSQKIRVYGLLTEPGEQTAVFSIFGSAANASHSWIVIQVNLTGVLGRWCNDSDYKQWSPTDDPNIDCLLGRRMIYERRRANSLCFNGRDYDREISTENCPCKIEDYECDFGFKKNHANLNTCSYDPDSGVNVTAVPSYCREGLLYNRTRGYRHVVGDTCEGGQADQYEPVQTICPAMGNQDFVLLANRTSIHRYIFSRRLNEILPLDSILDNVISLDYDYANDCVFWADSRQHNIKMRCLRGNDVMTKVIITENADAIEGLAYNWMSEQLFWVDSGNKRIEVARRDGSHRRVLVNSTLDRPRAIVVCPKFGFLFWSDWSSTNPRVTRAAMDGSSRTIIVQGLTRLHWPNGLAIDEQTLRLFITDAYLDRIVSCGFNGQDFSIVYSQSFMIRHPYAIGVFGDQLYWSDLSWRAILTAGKHGNQTIRILMSGISSITDLKVFHTQSQKGHSACNVSLSRCQSLCFEKPNAFSSVTTDFTCHCSDLLVENADGSCACAPGLILTRNGTCHTSSRNVTCNSYQFTCRNGNCIPNRYRCDGDNDCFDYSDEIGCAYSSCRSDQFQCNSGRCIPSSYRCDRDNDCGDMSDEPPSCSYATCAPHYFQCNNGRCIMSAWRCDYDNDCRDGSDEFNCSYNTHSPSCSPYQFQCRNPPLCIMRAWQCDGDRDCVDGSDELNCTAPGPVPCRGWTCNSTSTCIPSELRCNGLSECIDGSDEVGCVASSTSGPMSTTRGPCLPQEFRCSAGRWCIPLQGVCDGISDCPDNSDELDCNCPTSDHFRCANGRCIQSILRCNRRDDCRDNSDELNCGGMTTSLPCPFYMFSCSDGSCISELYVCNGVNDCAAGDDERFCRNQTRVTCSGNRFQCQISSECIPASGFCNGVEECEDGTDESFCTPPPAVCPLNQWQCGSGECIYDRVRCDRALDCVSRDDESNCTNVMASLSIGRIDSNLVEVKVNALIPQSSDKVKFLAVIRRESSRVVVNEFWTNLTSVPCSIMFDGLSSGTDYLITIAVNLNRTQGPPTHEMRVTTNATAMWAPFPPENISAKNFVLRRDVLVNISWIAPANTRGIISSYRVYIYDLSQNLGGNAVFRVPGTSRSLILGKTDILYGHKFQFQMSASNGQESHLSGPVNFTYAADTCVKANCSTTPTSKETRSLTANLTSKNFEQKIYLEWSYLGNESAEGIRNYFVRLASSATHYHQIFSYGGFTSSSNGHHVEIGGLNPGTEYEVMVFGYSRRNASIPVCPDSCSTTTTPGTLIPGPVISARSSSEFIYLSINCSLELLQNLAPGKNEVRLTVFYEEDDQIGGNHFNLFSESSNVTIPISLGEASSTCTTVHTFRNLARFRKYCFVALFTWPIRSQMSDTTCSFVCDDSASVSELRVLPVSLHGFFVDILIAWTDLCIGKQMINYMITVKDIEMDKSFSYYYENVGRGATSKILQHFHRGANYTVAVQRINPSNRAADFTFTTEPLPVPSTPDISPLAEDQWILSWTLSDIENYSECAPTFSVYFAKANESYSLLTETKEMRVTVKGNRMQQNGKTMVLFKIRVVSCRGNSGGFSKESALAGYDGVMVVLSTQSATIGPNTVAIAVSVPLAVIIVIVLAVLGYVGSRHCALRNSLQNFERTRYSSRTDAGVFGALVDDDDQPLVQNFSDDVPLIVT